MSSSPTLSKRTVLANARHDRLRHNFNYGLILGGGVSIIVALVIAILNAPGLQINTIILSGAVHRDSNLLRGQIVTILNQTYLSVVPKSNFLFYPKEEIRKQLLADPMFRNVEFTQVSTNTLMVHVVEREPSALACVGSFTMAGERNCNYLADDGTIFSRAPQFSAPVYFEWWSGTSTMPALGRTIVSEEIFTIVQSLIAQLTQAGLHIQAVEFGPDSFALVTDSGTHIFIDTSLGTEKLAEHILIAMASPSMSQHLRDRGSSLEYLDVRYGDKVFYKFSSSSNALP